MCLPASHPPQGVSFLLESDHQPLKTQEGWPSPWSGCWPPPSAPVLLSSERCSILLEQRVLGCGHGCMAVLGQGRRQGRGVSGPPTSSAVTHPRSAGLTPCVQLLRQTPAATHLHPRAHEHTHTHTHTCSQHLPREAGQGCPGSATSFPATWGPCGAGVTSPSFSASQ